MANHSKYKQHFPNDILAYFDVPKDKLFEKRLTQRTSNKNGETEKYDEVGCILPMFEEFAKKTGVSTTTMARWERKYPKWKDACDRCRDMQKYIMVQNGIRGSYNPIFMKIASINLMAWTDGRKDITSTIKREAAKLPDKDLSTEINKRVSNTTPFKKRNQA